MSSDKSPTTREVFALELHLGKLGSNSLTLCSCGYFNTRQDDSKMLICGAYSLRCVRFAIERLDLPSSLPSQNCWVKAGKRLKVKGEEVVFGRVLRTF